MRTSDFTLKPSAKVMNETLSKKFGEKLDIDNYSPEQLKKAASLIESRIAVLKKGKFNETLASEEFHRLKLMQDIVKTAISERNLKESKTHESAPPGKEAEEFIKSSKANFKKQYGDDWKSKLYATAWKKFGKEKKKDESVSEAKKMKEAPNEGNAFGDKVRKAKADGIQKGEKIKVGGKTYPVKESVNSQAVAKLAQMGGYGPTLPPDLIARIKNAKSERELVAIGYQIGDDRPSRGEIELVKQAYKELNSQMAEGMQDLYKNYIDKKGKDMEKHKKGGYTTTGKEKKKGEEARTKGRETSDKMAKALKKIKESYEYITEGEESKAELIMAVKDMVDKFTGWSEDIAQMQAQTAMEMADAIRDEMGADQAEAFTAAVQPALDAAFQSVKSAREALNNSVASLTGVAPTPMGAEPGMDDMGGDMGMEPGADLGSDMDAEMPTDDAEMDMDTDVGSPMDRAKRESIEHRLRLTKILVGR